MSVSTQKIKTKKVSFGHYIIHTEIMIDATPEQVWSVLIDTTNYPNWAVFMNKIDGEIRDNAEIDAYFVVNEKKQKVNKIRHTIAVAEGKEFSWSEVFMLGMKDYHRFIVEPTSDGKTRFVQSDLVTGGLTFWAETLLNLKRRITQGSIKR